MKIFTIFVLLLISLTLQQPSDTNNSSDPIDTPGSLFDNSCPDPNCEQCSSLKINNQNMCYKCKAGFYSSTGVCTSCSNLSNCKECGQNGCLSCEEFYEFSLGTCIPCMDNEKWNSVMKRCDKIYTPNSGSNTRYSGEIDSVGLIIAGSVFGGIFLIALVVVCCIITCIQRDHQIRLKKNLIHCNFSPEQECGLTNNGVVNQGVPLPVNNNSNRSEVHEMIDQSNNIKAPMYPDLHQL
jgi:hypothetical protein